MQRKTGLNTEHILVGQMKGVPALWLICFLTGEGEPPSFPEGSFVGFLISFHPLWTLLVGTLFGIRIWSK